MGGMSLDEIERMFYNMPYKELRGVRGRGRLHGAEQSSYPRKEKAEGGDSVHHRAEPKQREVPDAHAGLRPRL